ncbi:DNA-binding transcriptional regulator, AcrR family [Pseudomonas taetrolens]|uniref:DNA-binding transcriptional regulator, AcrR family n=1 Tax=Pseudomonas taetrolens TaxID=47884 RepID=A0A0J6JP45_PSETA|nr:TetR/AcrR family transcriptional regulator [Pseudomonas taetrolens]KMM85582.1 TetR family transcriptional regulator [Pseudomonas taetrolens]SEC20180.1 DNA-binding transcriptional regulator, AcrR family [Pseudomonas taetrolens]SQF86139.1 transcriptional regulator [Pseudomonas taetrolens]VEH49215.1 transcriptional regulator [Pseudomonas taetrolens]
MAQIKKMEIRDAIVESAFTLFKHKGYTATTMSSIAREAGVTVSNLYVYFDSKFLILYAIYTPWFQDQVVRLKDSVSRLRQPRARLKRILIGVWSELPMADQAFANCMIEALASAPRQQSKPNDLLKWAEAQISEMMLETLPQERHHLLDDGLLAHILWMAFDGFVINQRVGDCRDMEKIADLFTDMLLPD